MVRWLLKRPSSLEMGKPWKDWLGTERATEVWLLPCKVIELITCPQWHRISQAVTALWGYHPVACNCLSQLGLRHGRIQTNSISLWLLEVPFPFLPHPAFSFSELMSLLSEQKQKIQNNHKPTGSNLFCYIVGMVLCWADVSVLWW